MGRKGRNKKKKRQLTIKRKQSEKEKKKRNLFGGKGAVAEGEAEEERKNNIGNESVRSAQMKGAIGERIKSQTEGKHFVHANERGNTQTGHLGPPSLHSSHCSIAHLAPAAIASIRRRRQERSAHSREAGETDGAKRPIRKLPWFPLLHSTQTMFPTAPPSKGKPALTLGSDRCMWRHAPRGHVRGGRAWTQAGAFTPQRGVKVKKAWHTGRERSAKTYMVNRSKKTPRHRWGPGALWENGEGGIRKRRGRDGEGDRVQQSKVRAHFCSRTKDNDMIPHGCAFRSVTVSLKHRRQACPTL